VFGAVIGLRSTVRHHDDHGNDFAVCQQVVEEYVGRGRASGKPAFPSRDGGGEQQRKSGMRRNNLAVRGV
jgi:hypothetical protein